MEDASRRPANAVQEKDRGQLKPREARNQEEVCAEDGHALESVATPGSFSRKIESSCQGSGKASEKDGAADGEHLPRAAVKSKHTAAENLQCPRTLNSLALPSAQ
ncbi:hypothetical protein NDU88_008946 [Pleurodeles waltl]|uniref:Uncharacterized protein n=1 Tax=Pleurodeles waltl TaxID=8319 RepID=A0AAV7QW65_PLEWA|nr:hypothetical protein NDU88_008946 [Pleurodeles waltl]